MDYVVKDFKCKPNTRLLFESVKARLGASTRANDYEDIVADETGCMTTSEILSIAAENEAIVCNSEYEADDMKIECIADEIESRVRFLIKQNIPQSEGCQTSDQ